MKIIAVLLPVFNAIEYTKKALINLQELEKPVEGSGYSFIHIVIDDGSSDGTSEFIRIHFPNVILLKGDGNLWWSGSVNRGAEYAVNTMNADFLLLWNNDIKADSNYFLTLTGILEKADKKLVIGSKIYSDKDTIWSMGGTFNPYTGKKIHLAYSVKDSAEYNQVITADWLPGMGTILPASVLEQVGLWDEKNFPQYHGDSDYTYRTKLAGYTIKVFPELKIWNDISNTGIEHRGSFRTLLKSLRQIKSYNNIRKDLLFYRKYARSPLAFWALCVKYGRLFGGFFKWKLLNAMGIKKPDFIPVQ
jgi:GT2 family glycosyltransferase